MTNNADTTESSATEGAAAPSTAALTTARFRRRVAAGCLASTAVLSTASVLLQPDFGDTTAERLRLIDDAGASATVSVVCFVLAQLPFLGAALGIGHLIRRRAPRLANAAPAIAVVGGFGHAVFGGAMLLTASMATAAGSRDPYVEVVERFESSPAMIFAAMGLVGTVVGLLLLAAGLWRAAVGPRWVPGAMVAFVVVEFAGSALTTWAAPLAAALYLAAMGALAMAVLRTTDVAWQAGDRS